MRLGIPSFALELLLWLTIVLSSYKNLRSCRNEVWKDFWFIIGFCSKSNVRPFMAEHRGSPKILYLEFFVKDSLVKIILRMRLSCSFLSI